MAFKEISELEKDKKNISEYPLVKAILSEFNGAKIETILRKAVADAEDNDIDYTTEYNNNYEYED